MATTNRAFDESHYNDWRDPHELVPYQRNAKIHDDKQVKNIANSIRRFGWQQEAVITSDNVLVIGHGRRLAAIKLGCKIPVKVIDKEADDLTDKDIRELRIADNLTNESPWDLDLLNGELAELDMDGFDFDVELDDEPEPEVVEDYYDKDLPTEPKAKRGDLYLLGEHRLFCGDSTDQADVDRLMGGDIADVFLTDPPYNVDYTGGTGMKIMNDHMEQNRFRQFLTDAFTTADQVMRPGAGFLHLARGQQPRRFPGRMRCGGLGDPPGAGLGKERPGPWPAGLPMAARALPLRMERRQALLHRRQEREHGH